MKIPRAVWLLPLVLNSMALGLTLITHQLPTFIFALIGLIVSANFLLADEIKEN